MIPLVSDQVEGADGGALDEPGADRSAGAPRQGIQSVELAMTVLLALEQSAGPLSLTQIAASHDNDPLDLDPILEKHGSHSDAQEVSRRVNAVCIASRVKGSIANPARASSSDVFMWVFGSPALRNWSRQTIVPVGTPAKSSSAG